MKKPESREKKYEAKTYKIADKITNEEMEEMAKLSGLSWWKRGVWRQSENHN